jgi:hypothetical protein
MEVSHPRTEAPQRADHDSIGQPSTEDAHTILVSTSDESHVLAALVLDRAVSAAERTPDGIRVTLRPGQDADVAATAVTRRLMHAGADVRIIRV